MKRLLAAILVLTFVFSASVAFAAPKKSAGKDLKSPGVELQGPSLPDAFW
ncbi:MAG: hypothetical protein M1553_14705 [Firmicutes bacterium]|nr:hypothetical protein [Bacillota bacterium]